MSESSPKSISILMIEDDVSLCEGWTDLFEMLGHEITCFQRATDALQNTQALGSSDLIITDYYLPDMNGVELVKQLRKKKIDAPTIVLTGSRESFIADSISELSNCQILYKPLNIDEIEEQISQLFPA